MRALWRVNMDSLTGAAMRRWGDHPLPLVSFAGWYPGSIELCPSDIDRASEVEVDARFFEGAFALRSCASWLTSCGTPSDTRVPAYVIVAGCSLFIFQVRAAA